MHNRTGASCYILYSYNIHSKFDENLVEEELPLILVFTVEDLKMSSLRVTEDLLLE